MKFNSNSALAEVCPLLSARCIYKFMVDIDIDNDKVFKSFQITLIKS